MGEAAMTPRQRLNTLTTCALKRHLRTLHAQRREAGPEQDRVLLQLIRTIYSILRERSFQCG